MLLWLQWVICAALGLWALVMLARKFGLAPQRRRASDDGCAGGGCAHCEAAKSARPPASTK